MRGIISGFLLLLCLFATLSVYTSGEVLRKMEGNIQKCGILGGNTLETVSHATIRSENGHYIIASSRNCSVGKKVTVLIKRGALYFNTVYAVDETSSF